MALQVSFLMTTVHWWMLCWNNVLYTKHIYMGITRVYFGQCTSIRNIPVAIVPCYIYIYFTHVYTATGVVEKAGRCYYVVTTYCTYYYILVYR